MVYILDVVPCIVSPPKQSMKESKRAGVNPRRPVAGSLSFRGRGDPPLLNSPMSNTKKMAESKGRWIGPMKRTAKHVVRSPHVACTKKRAP